jgi:type I restriction enzyme, S subunit
MLSDRAETALPSGWRTVRFDQIAENIAERVEPAEADTDIYVGLEHLDPDSLRLRRWGTPADVEGTKLRFYPGDVIFGRRRAYQRKLAVAEVEGICSAHAMVLRAKPDVCLPEFLPFFLQSERFFERAIAISVGSLSPTINWKTLAMQEFPLPSLDEQRRIAEILWAAEEAIQQFEESAYLLALAKQRYFDDQTGATTEGSQAVVTLGNICTVQNGQVDPTAPPYNRMVHIAPDDIESGTGRILEMRTAEDDHMRSGKYEFSAQAILYSKIRPNLRKVAYPKFTGVCSADVYPLYPRAEMVEPDFLFHLLLSKGFTDYAVTHSVRSAIPKINRESLLLYTFSLPSIERQRRTVSALQMFAVASAKCAQHIEKSRKIRTVLLNRLCQPEQG